MTESNYITLDDARHRIAARWGRPVPLATIAKWARQGKLAGAVRVQTGGRGQGGMRWLVPEDTVAAFEPPKVGRPTKQEVAQRKVDALLQKR